MIQHHFESHLSHWFRTPDHRMEVTAVMGTSMCVVVYMCFFGSRCACTSAVVVSLCLQTLQLHYLSELSYSYQWCSFLCFLVSSPSSELWSLLLSLWRRRWSRHPMCVTSGCRRRSRRTHASLFRRRRQLWVMQSFPTLVSMVAIARCPLLSLSKMTIAPYRSQTARSDRCSRTAIHPAWMMIASRESRATQTHPAFMRCWTHPATQTHLLPVRRYEKANF